jgi:hypothetical protein
MLAAYSDVEKRVLRAYKAYSNDKFTSLRSTAAQYDAPYDRVLARYNRRTSRSERDPTNRLLTKRRNRASVSGLNAWTSLERAYRSECSSISVILFLHVATTTLIHHHVDIERNR